jgi:hypothetical protein
VPADDDIHNAVQDRKTRVCLTSTRFAGDDH